jgi:hypothetical protein
MSAMAITVHFEGKLEGFKGMRGTDSAFFGEALAIVVASLGKSGGIIGSTTVGWVMGNATVPTGGVAAGPVGRVTLVTIEK